MKVQDSDTFVATLAPLKDTVWELSVALASQQTRCLQQGSRVRKTPGMAGGGSAEGVAKGNGALGSLLMLIEPPQRARRGEGVGRVWAYFESSFVLPVLRGPIIPLWHYYSLVWRYSVLLSRF